MKMHDTLKVLKNEQGSLILITVVILMVLTVIGISMTTTTSIELQIAGNDKLIKTAFYEADGAIDVGAEVIEQNLGCVGAPGGFTEDVIGDDSSESSDTSTAIRMDNLSVWQNTSATAPSDTNRDFHFPDGYAAGDPHTNLTAGGNTVLSTGAAIQMVAGYEGKGKGAGGGGGYIAYDLYSQYLGVSNSESVIMVQWRHVIGQEGACNY
jgi:PilX N-terminal